MFARIALRTARLALVRSPYSFSIDALGSGQPPMRFNHSSRSGIVRRRARRLAAPAPSLLETALARARELVPELESPLRARSRLLLHESTVLG